MKAASFYIFQNCIGVNTIVAMLEVQDPSAVTYRAIGCELNGVKSAGLAFRGDFCPNVIFTGFFQNYIIHAKNGLERRKNREKAVSDGW